MRHHIGLQRHNRTPILERSCDFRADNNIQGRHAISFCHSYCGHGLPSLQDDKVCLIQRCWWVIRDSFYVLWRIKFNRTDSLNELVNVIR